MDNKTKDFETNRYETESQTKKAKHFLTIIVLRNLILFICFQNKLLTIFSFTILISPRRKKMTTLETHGVKS